MDLLFDVGNTNVSYALSGASGLKGFDRVGITEVSFLVQLRSAIIDVSEKHRIKRVAICSVNPKASDALIRALMKLLPVDIYICDQNLPVDIETTVAHPERIGRDRLLSGLAAWREHRSACIVVDMGSAITVDLIDEEGVFRGGAIGPGLRMSAHGLSRNTAMLPEVKPAKVTHAIGRDTESAIASGLYFGFMGMVRELVTRIRDEYGKPVEHVIATGGDCALLAPEMDLFTDTAADLTLRGLSLCLPKEGGKKRSRSGQ